MQRRMWTYLGIADIMFSFQVGLRSMIKLEDIKANIPSNIHDDHNFHEHIESLPAPLPLTEITSISFMITKAQLAIDFAVTLQELSIGEQMHYDRVLEIDQHLRKSYDSLAEHYKLHTLSRADKAPLTLIASRFMLANLHYKSICVLHSRYLGLSRHHQRFLYSRRSCLEAAMQLLNFQAIQHEQSIARGSIHNLNKYQTSLTTHDFLLAATLVSTALSLDSNGSPFEGRSDAGPSRNELMTAVERTIHIWIYLRDRSAEAFMAADVLSMLLMKFRKEDDMRAADRSPGVEQIAKLVSTERKPRQSQWWHSNEAPRGSESPAPADRCHYSNFDCTDTSAFSDLTTIATESLPSTDLHASVNPSVNNGHNATSMAMSEAVLTSTESAALDGFAQSQVRY